MVSRAMNTRPLSAYEQVLLFHPLHVEKEPGVRDVKAPIYGIKIHLEVQDKSVRKRKSYKRNVSIGAPFW